VGGGRHYHGTRRLRATLDWSYELLPEPERVLLRRLAVFAGVFSLEAASAVAASAEAATSRCRDFKRIWRTIRAASAGKL
jgi:predicted ATPase